MKKITTLLLLTITILGMCPQEKAIARNTPVHNIQITKKLTDKLVYTNDNKTYHRSSCKRMGYSNPIKTSVAISRNYMPCKSCRP